VYPARHFCPFAAAPDLNGLGRMLTADKDVNSSTISEIEYAYNDISKVTDANQKLFGGTNREIDYTYDQRGYPNSIEYPDGNEVYITPDFKGRISTVAVKNIGLSKHSQRNCKY